MAAQVAEDASRPLFTRFAFRRGAKSPDHDPAGTGPRTLPMALAALGVVYGDIGTSPLYAIKECFHGPHAVPLSEHNILGVMSLVFWSLMFVVSIKYVTFIMRADNHGEGGIFALAALLLGRGKARMSKSVVTKLTLLATFGAALLYGDGVITPAISVLSAVEGLSVATHALEPAVVPLTCLILFVFFLMQHHGTERIGRIFGPIMILWFLTLGLLGFVELAKAPEVVSALSPWRAAVFFAENGLHGMVVLGSVVLCITGGEALYADMGHFGARPIRLAWYVVVLPGLTLNYLGQCALLLTSPESAFNPFYALVPRALLYPMVILSTMATIIASQAMISGVYSLTQQAIQLGFSPRLRIVHTSGETKGQIYMPWVNAMLMLACIGLVLAFRESSRLAAAYGIAVTATMAITTVLYYYVTHFVWGWPRWKAFLPAGLFICCDAAFLGANLLKIVDGGWFTLAVAGTIMLLMVTWRDGRNILAKRFADSRLPVDVFLRDIAAHKPVRVPGTAVFLSVSPQGVPLALLHHFKHNEALHERVILLSITSAEQPFVPPDERLDITYLGQGFYRLVASYGFMESPSIPDIMKLAGPRGLEADIHSTSFYLGRETLLTTGEAKMASWRKGLFVFLSRNAWNATTFFRIPPGRVVELGSQIEL